MLSRLAKSIGFTSVIFKVTGARMFTRNYFLSVAFNYLSQTGLSYLSAQRKRSMINANFASIKRIQRAPIPLSADMLKTPYQEALAYFNAEQYAKAVKCLHSIIAAPNYAPLTREDHFLNAEIHKLLAISFFYTNQKKFSLGLLESQISSYTKNKNNYPEAYIVTLSLEAEIHLLNALLEYTLHDNKKDMLLSAMSNISKACVQFYITLNQMKEIKLDYNTESLKKLLHIADHVFDKVFHDAVKNIKTYTIKEVGELITQLQAITAYVCKKSERYNENCRLLILLYVKQALKFSKAGDSLSEKEVFKKALTTFNQITNPTEKDEQYAKHWQSLISESNSKPAPEVKITRVVVAPFKPGSLDNKSLLWKRPTTALNKELRPDENRSPLMKR